MSTYDMLRAHYATRSDEELKTLGGTPDLPPDARRALDDELAHRKADPEVRRQAAIAALMAGLEQEKEEHLARTRRALSIALGVAMMFAAALTFYVMQQVVPVTGKHKGLLILLTLVVVVAAGVWVVRRLRQAKLDQHLSDDS